MLCTDVNIDQIHMLMIWLALPLSSSQDASGSRPGGQCRTAAWHRRSLAPRTAWVPTGFLMMLTRAGFWDLRGSKGIFKNCTWAQKKVHKITSLCLWVPPSNSLPSPNTWEGNRIEGEEEVDCRGQWSKPQIRQQTIEANEGYVLPVCTVYARL